MTVDNHTNATNPNDDLLSFCTPDVPKLFRKIYPLNEISFKGRYLSMFLKFYITIFNFDEELISKYSRK